MKKYNNILDIFPSEEMKIKVNEIVIIIDDLSRRLPILTIQNVSNEDNEFYDGMTYSEFASWICESSKQLSERLIAKESMYDEDDFKTQAHALIRLFDVLTVLWWKCYPGLATECSITTINGNKTSIAGMVFKQLSVNMKDLGYPEFKFTID